MNLAIFLSFKETMKIMRTAGQDGRFINYYLEPYSRAFDHIYIFSYGNETFEFPFKNVTLVPNRKNTPIYWYNFTLPFAEKEILKTCRVVRLMQFTSIIPAIIAKKLYGIKVIATYGFPYSIFLKVKKSYLKFALWRLVELLTLKQTDKFIVTYEGNEKFLLKNGVSKEKVALLPNGVDTSIFRPTDKGFDEKNIRLLFVGRLEVEKNLIGLAQAIASSKYKKALGITFIGKGSLQGEIEKILKDSGIRHKIIPSLPHQELIAHYQQADIFMLPSFAEGYPKVLVEAMACGLPSVVGKYEGYEYVVSDKVNALSCEHSAKDITAKLDELIENVPLRKIIAKGARKFTEEHNDIKKILQKEIEVIQSL
jgi:glycosyltransferase involved in cell wall biosynthesis